MFKPITLFYSDGYKVAHQRMLAPNTSRLYGTLIPRSVKYAPKGITKIVSFGQQLVVTWLHDEFNENFFGRSREEALTFAEDMSVYLGMVYDGRHFDELWQLGYLPIKIKALPEGIETGPNIPHMTFINTKKGFAWLTLYLETVISSLAWKASTSATIALNYKRNLTEWVMKTDPSNAFLIPFLCHDFSARGLSVFDSLSSGLGHATSFMGSDSVIVIPGARYFYDEEGVSIASVNASEHSVTCTGIFYYDDLLRSGKLNDEIKWYYSFDVPCEGSIEEPDYLAISEYLNLRDWLAKFPNGILSVVSDTFNLWKLITYILPRLKDQILERNGKLVIRPDSGDPVDIVCGYEIMTYEEAEKFVYGSEYRYNTDGKCIEENGKLYPIYVSSWEDGTINDIYADTDEKPISISEQKGVIELLWDIFGGTVNEQGYKVLDSHIGAIYGDSITIDRQVSIYERLVAKGFASTNIVLGVGSFTYQYNTRDTLGFAVKGAWFEVDGPDGIKSYNIYKDPITDDSKVKKSLKGLQCVFQDENGEYYTKGECTEEEESQGLLQTIYHNGALLKRTTLAEIRENINKLI